MLSAVAHGNEPGGVEVVVSTLDGLKGIDTPPAAVYPDIIWTVLEEAVRKEVEKMIAIKDYKYQTDLFKKPFAEGKAEGTANSILAFLTARGLQVTDKQREAILSCRDLGTLERWVARAATADSVEAVLDGGDAR